MKNGCVYKNCGKAAIEKGLCSEHYKTQAEIDKAGIPAAVMLEIEPAVVCKKCGAKKDGAAGRFYKGVCAKCRTSNPTIHAKKGKKPAVKAVYPAGGGKLQGKAALNPQVLIAMECDRLKAMLLEKNRKYGNSALAPCRIFSKADTTEQINVRLDDKLSRMASAQGDDYEDAEFDFIGYMLLKRVARNMSAAGR